MLEKTEWYNDWILPQEDVCGGGGAVLIREKNRTLVLGGNIRRKDVDRLENGWLDLVSRVAPAVRQAVEVTRALSGMTVTNLLLRAGTDPDVANILLLNRYRRILFASRGAQAMLQQGWPVSVGAQGDLACLVNGFCENAFAAALDRVFARGMASEALPLPSGHILRVVPLDTSVVPTAPFGTLWFAEGTVALLVISTAPAAPQSATVLRDLTRQFNLTKAEAAIALLINQGMTLAEIADKRGASIHTVRN